MDTRQAYNVWAGQYDTNINKTRDLEATALRETLGNIPFDAALEIGCGTGKNTVWLKEHAKQLTSVDLSEEMLAKARQKVNDAHVKFVQADIMQPWHFAENNQYNLVSFSLVLEHIENLFPVFQQVSSVLCPGGYVYIGELHPFKQYAGSKARFETENGTQIVNCFNHHVSDFTEAGKEYGLDVYDVKEYFDDNDRTTLPRLLVAVLKKNNV
ncbi:class I SAM-dependent DNA methyltransferase [Foetidibacter luteolus]|uniref:class I SAM-dependent DNA methyltransferase n=1 Tax=Foetidibacter luteolus TaxID=2608880 RepID=UPI00129ADA68|nr:class I SAM-dependent methyltransferase [Foetidibacter luteolus]